MTMACDNATRPPMVAVWLTHKTVPCWEMTAANAARLARALPGATIRLCANREEFLAVLPDADTAVVWTFRQEWFARAPRLRWLATPAAGRELLGVEAVPPHLRVTYGTFHGQLIGETVLGMMLASARGLLAGARLQALEPWPQAELARIARPLRGSHVAIVGFGHIGAWIARLAKPFGVRITGLRRAPEAAATDMLDADDRVLAMAELDRVLPGADHLILCLPAAAETNGLMNRVRLGLLPPHAVLYNVGRGNAVDETALAEALGAGRLAGACLDVYQGEPLPASSPLRTAPNALLLPHASAMAPNYLDLFIDEFAALGHR